MSLGGGLLGVALARGLLPALVSELPLRVVLNAQIGLDARVLLFTLVVSVATGLLFGLLPAIGASGVSLVDALKGDGRGTGSAGGRGRIRSGLVIGELALALVLLIGAGLMLRSFNQLQAVDPGFRTTGIATMWVSLPDAEYTDTAAWMQFYERLLERVEALPGVRRVGMNNVIPLGTGGSESETLPDNRPVEFEATASALFQTVNGAYFEALGIPLLRGRTFDSRDLDARAHVAIVDETMAAAFWPGEDPIGRRVAFEFDGDPDNIVPLWRTVVVWSVTYVTTTCACPRASKSTSPSPSRRRTSTGAGGRCRSSSRPTATRRTRSAPCATSSPGSTRTSRSIPSGRWTRFSWPRSASTAC